MDPNGTIEVTEIIEARFTGFWHGIFRTIPGRVRRRRQHLNYSLLLEPLSVTDDDGHPLKYEQKREGRYLKFKITVPDAQDATTTVMLHYRILDAIRFFDDHDELYWNVTGDRMGCSNPHLLQRANRIARRRHRPARNVPSPAPSDHAHRMRKCKRRQHRRDRVPIIRCRFTKVLPSWLAGTRDSFTARVGGREIALFLRSNWPLFLPIVAFLIMFWLWWTRGRDPERDSIAVQYEPPDKLTPGECGTLVDNEAAMRDITATLVDLAVKGYLTIEQKDESHLLGLSHSKEYIFHLKRPATEWSGARPHELANALRAF